MSSIYPLPDLIESISFWSIDRYQKHLNELFLEHINAKLNLFGKDISSKRFEEINGMHRGFWHLVTEDLEKTFIDEDRFFVMSRAERILWIPHLIKNINSKDLKCWENIRRKKKGKTKNIVIWLESESYMIVLENRANYILLKTAYIHDNKTRARNSEEYAKYGDCRQKTGTA